MEFRIAKDDAFLISERFLQTAHVLFMPCFIRAEEAIPGLDGASFEDFWSWAYSDVLSNANRSVFAEYLVGCALGALERPRVEWDGCDLLYRGKKIEVKASAYIQSWQQKQLSKIVFDIAPHRAWDAVTNVTVSEPARTADCYVFCLFADRDRDTCRVADSSRWLFYVVSTQLLNQHFPGQKTARLSSIERISTPVSFQQLRTEIDRALNRATAVDLVKSTSGLCPIMI